MHSNNHDQEKKKNLHLYGLSRILGTNTNDICIVPYSMTHLPSDPIGLVKGVGPATKEKLLRLGIDLVRDLVYHLPRLYMDFSQPTEINKLSKGTAASFVANIEKPRTFYTHSGKLLTQATAKDQNGSVLLVWFNNPYIKKLIIEGKKYQIAGKPTFFGQKLALVSPIIEESGVSTLNTKGLVAIYNQTSGISSRWLRQKISQVIKNTTFDDPLPQEIRQKNLLISWPESLKQIHFPDDKKTLLKADERLSYNEHLSINIKNYIERHNLGRSIAVDLSSKINNITSQKIPFNMTRGQQRVIADIQNDLSNSEFTHRLIQGETGSGKTIPLIFAANQIINSNLSCAILAPTEILANQHFDTFKKYIIKADSVQLITGSTKTTVRPEPTIYIGTHALLNQIPKNLTPPLAFVAIDEQHRFGVKQRELLTKRKPIPHLFNLSATPIPRTVALGLLGDIKTSNILHKPSNRLPIKTFTMSPTKFNQGREWLINHLENGGQIFAVCPHISENSSQITSVEKQTKAYQQLLPPKYPIFSLHGKISSEKRLQVLSQFKNTPGSVLVSTSIIEVGVDIPSVNIIIIHSAEIFGLAQLHQLRGRVGRGQEQGYCFLVPTEDDDVETSRLQLLQKYHSGITLAKKDLKLRGAGQIYGVEQHGLPRTTLKYFWSRKLFALAKRDASYLVQRNRRKALEIVSQLIP